MIAVLATSFWILVLVIAWTYVGFPAALALRPRRPTPRHDPAGSWPSVSYVIVVYNERAVIDDKLANVEALDYPRDRLEVIIASDGSDDGTNERVAAHRGAHPIKLLSLERIGKNAALNAAVAATNGEIIVFSDADSMLNPGALRALVAPFQDPEIGGVGGDYYYEESEPGGASERQYWNIDRVWKRLESRSGNMTSATGQIYGIRRALFETVPDGVTDDFFVSTGAIAASRRLYFEPAAIAVGPVAETAEAEFRRKVRMMTRGFASLWARRSLLNPRKTGFYALQLATHKISRRLLGLPFLGIAICTPWLVNTHPIYAVAALGQAAVYSLALAGWMLRASPIGHSRLLALPFFFVMVNYAGLRAGWDFALGRRHLGWVPHRVPAREDLEAKPKPSLEGS